MIFPDPMSWQHFVQLPQIKKLSLNEQTQRYNYYLMEQQALMAQIMAQHTAGSSGGGHEPPPSPSITPSISVTPSVTPSISITPSITPSISVTPSVTPSITPTPSV